MSEATPGPPSSYAGRLLVAVPPTDPVFERTVVLVLDHDEAGALGLVLNRPGELAVGAVLPGWADAVDLPPVLFLGGPVAVQGAVCLGAVDPARRDVDDVPGLRPVAGGLVLVDLDGDPDALPLTHARVYAGYAGWSPGQLDAEVEAGGWVVVDLLPGDPWASRPERLWTEVLRRQQGAARYLATHPGDVTLN